MILAEKYVGHLAWLNAILYAALCASLTHAVMQNTADMIPYMPVAYLLAGPIPIVTCAAHVGLLARANARGVWAILLGMALSAPAFYIGVLAVDSFRHTIGPRADAGVAMAVAFIGMWFVCWLALTSFSAVLTSELVILRPKTPSWLTPLGGTAFFLSLGIVGWPLSFCLALAALAGWWAVAARELMR